MLQGAYLDQMEFAGSRNPWLLLYTSGETKYSGNTFYSLVNTALTLGLSPQGKTEAWSLNSPPPSYFTKAAESQASYAVQLLVLLLNFEPPTYEQLNTMHPQAAVQLRRLQLSRRQLSRDSLPQLVNVYRTYASSLEDAEHFEMIFNNIVRLLQLSLKPVSFLSSVPKISFNNELIVLLWQLMQLNPAFMNYIAEECEILQLLEVLTVYVTEAKEDENKLNICQLCLFMLLSLSSVREFNVKLGQPFSSHLPVFNLSLETYYDLQVVFLHTLIFSKNVLATQTGCLMSILYNMSIYAKSIDAIASNKLVHLLECFSSPSLLFSEEVYGGYLQLSLDIINTRLQYHWDVIEK